MSCSLFSSFTWYLLNNSFTDKFFRLAVPPRQKNHELLGPSDGWFLDDLAHLELRCWADTEVLVQRKDRRPQSIDGMIGVELDRFFTILAGRHDDDSG